jgi:hypothetical protein
VNKLLTAVLTLAVTAFYIPLLRKQVRDGVTVIPLGASQPISIRYDEHPYGFWISVAVQGALIAMLVSASLLLAWQGIEP